MSYGPWKVTWCKKNSIISFVFNTAYLKKYKCQTFQIDIKIKVTECTFWKYNNKLEKQLAYP